jgi:hypothetical protein
MSVAAAVETKRYPFLSGAFLVALALALVLASWLAGTESYPYIHRRISYRFPLATLDRVYLAALAILAVHYMAYVIHYLTVGSRQSATAPAPALEFSAVKFVITWFFVIGLLGAYTLGASIATPSLFDAAFGPARETASVRIWNHTYFGFLLLASIIAGVVYFIARGIHQHGAAGALRSISSGLSLAAGHRFVGVLNWILMLSILSNIATGFFILGSAPLLAFPRIPLHSYALENVARLVHDVGTAFIIASFSGQIYLRLIPGNQWMLKTMFGGYEPKV